MICAPLSYFQIACLKNQKIQGWAENMQDIDSCKACDDVTEKNLNTYSLKPKYGGNKNG